MRISSFPEGAIPGEREIRCDNLWRSYCIDAACDLGSITYIQGTRHLLCVLDLVHLQIWEIRIHHVIEHNCSPHHECPYDIH